MWGTGAREYLGLRAKTFYIIPMYGGTFTILQARESTTLDDTCQQPLNSRHNSVLVQWDVY